MFDWFLIQCIVDIPVVVFAQNKQKRTKGFVNVRDINQGLYLCVLTQGQFEFDVDMFY